jgi:hypothetical protein
MSLGFAQNHRPASFFVDMLAVLVIMCISLVGLSLPVAAKAARLPRLGGTAHVWKFHRTMGTRTIELSVGWTACNADLVPTFRKYVTESHGRATITILEEAREVPAGTRCFKSRGTRRLRVRLDQQFEKLKVFDGSFSPPALRFRGAMAPVTERSGSEVAEA